VHARLHARGARSGRPGTKARAAQAALAICNDALQMHGAIGYTDEYDLGLYLNRALVLSAWLGNASAHRNRYAGLMETA
jgi:alkylation response protein AidB-like acyl-CoA dehydrogenase